MHTNPVCSGEAHQLFYSSKARASDVHSARIGRKRCFYGCPRVSLCYEVLLFIFDYQLNRDNSVVLVVSPLLFADDKRSGWCSSRDRRPGKTPCSHCTINWRRCVKPHPCNLMSTSVISFYSHMFSAIKFTHARTVRTRLSFFLAVPPPDISCEAA